MKNVNRPQLDIKFTDTGDGMSVYGVVPLKRVKN